ncbi:MAG: hypothetical protein J0M33_23830 [Anaerolineae bacterium]|nr:hypothetical protein [Anaerolineae bacterium]
MKHLYDYLRGKETRKDKLPRLAPSLTTYWKPEDLDDQIELMMMSGRFRDVYAAREWLEQCQVQTAREALALLPKRKRKSWLHRLKLWAQGLEGSYPTDPNRAGMLEWMKEQRRG